ncbi:MAG: hypothetical protein MJE68_16185 [Proteobacteria bacterium]|nr:hypothetical protein [Pseudomonadota bacterium]
MEEKLQLSDLHRGVDYPMACEEDADRCRIHVKMTEISMKSVEALIHSDKVCTCSWGMGYPGAFHCVYNLYQHYNILWE